MASRFNLRHAPATVQYLDIGFSCFFEEDVKRRLEHHVGKMGYFNFGRLADDFVSVAPAGIVSFRQRRWAALKEVQP